MSGKTEVPMIISLIAAMSENRVIGREGKLPWSIPADLARFKCITMGHAVLMGRKTFDSIGRPLPGRRNIVLSKTAEKIEGCEITRSLQEAIALAEGDEEIIILGGEEVFREALPLCQRIYLTVVHGSYQGDVHFPEIPAGFSEMSRVEREDVTPPLSFLVYEKVERLQPGADCDELRRKGLEAIQRQLYFLARHCFEQALTHGESVENSSDLAYCLAKTSCDLAPALRLAEQALAREPDNPRLHFNLGRIQVLSGAKEKGLATLREGMRLGGGTDLLAELAKYGTRLPPPIQALPRHHPLNRYLGLMLRKMGIR